MNKQAQLLAKIEEDKRCSPDMKAVFKFLIEGLQLQDQTTVFSSRYTSVTMEEEECDFNDNFENESFDDFAPEGNDDLDGSIVDDLHSLDIGPISDLKSGSGKLSVPRALSVIQEESRIETGPPSRAASDERMAAGFNPDDEESSAFGSTFNAASFQGDSDLVPGTFSDEFHSGASGLQAIEDGQRSFYNSPGHVFIPNDPRFNLPNNKKEHSWEISPPSYLRDSRQYTSSSTHVTPKKSGNNRSLRRVLKRDDLETSMNKSHAASRAAPDVQPIVAALPVDTASPLRATSRFVSKQNETRSGSSGSPKAVMNASAIKASTPNGRVGTRPPPLLCDVSAINLKSDSPKSPKLPRSISEGTASVFSPVTVDQSSINLSTLHKELDGAMAESNKTTDDLLAVLENIRKKSTKRVTAPNFSTSVQQKSMVNQSSRMTSALPPRPPLRSTTSQHERHHQSSSHSTSIQNRSRVSTECSGSRGGSQEKENISQQRLAPIERENLSRSRRHVDNMSSHSRPASSASVAESCAISRPVSVQSSRPNTGMSSASSTGGSSGPLRIDKQMVAFGFVETGDCVRDSVQVTNRTDSRLRIKLTLSKTNSDYFIPNGNVLSLDAGESTTILLEFKPSAAARIINTLTITVISGTHTGKSYTSMLRGSGGIARVCLMSHPEISISKVSGTHVMRTCSRTGLSFKLVNKGVRPAYCKVLVMSGDKLIDDCTVNPSPAFVVAKREQVSLRVEIPGMESYMAAGLDFRSSTTSLDSHYSTGRRNSHGGHLRLVLLWGEETQRQRLKIYHKRSNDNCIFHGTSFLTSFTNEKPDFVEPTDTPVTGRDKPVFELGCRKTEIMVVSANAVLRDYTNDGEDTDASFGPDSTILRSGACVPDCTMVYDVTASTTMLKKPD